MSVEQSQYATRVPEALVGLGAGIIALQVGVQILFNGVSGLLTVDGLLSVVLTGMFAIPVIAGGIWLTKADVSSSRFLRVAAWCLALLAVILTINLVMIAVWPAESATQNVSWAVQAAAMGAAGGTVFGSIEARSIERARTAERAVVRSEQLEAQREWLEYLNSLLRHEVLNNANVINGYAELLLAKHSDKDEARNHLERIARQSQKMTDVIQDVRLLIQATNEDVTLESIDVVGILERELIALEDRFDNVAVVTDFPDQAPVLSDELLSRVFSNLLSNAVEHNDSETPRVSVSVETSDELVTVTISDNGPGITDHEQDELFENTRQGDHGLGLYLVRQLLDRYDGTVELAETGSNGSTFDVALPQATEASITNTEAEARTPKAT